MTRLNLGCGYDIREGYINIDKWKTHETVMEVNLDLNILPFKTDDVEEILMLHIFEHLKEPMEFLKEMYRVSKNGAKWIIEVPYVTNTYQGTLTHLTKGFNENTFTRYTKNIRKYNVGQKKYYSDIDLEILKIELIPIGYQKYLPFKGILKHFLNNIYANIRYELMVIK